MVFLLIGAGDVSAFLAEDLNFMQQNSITPDRPENWNIEYLGSCLDITYTHIIDVVTQNNYAYVISHSDYMMQCPNYFGALDIIDISTDTPTIVATLSYQQGSNIELVIDIDVQDDRAYILDRQTCGSNPLYIDVIDISDPTEPYLMNQFEVDQSIINEIQICCNGEFVYLFRPGSLLIYYSTYLYEPITVFPVDFTEVNDFVVRGQKVYLIGEAVIETKDDTPDSIPVFEIIDCTDISNPQLLSEILCESATHIAVTTYVNINSLQNSRDCAYLTTNTGLQIIDITDPLQPLIRDSYLMSSPPLEIILEGIYAYVSCESSEIIVLDLSYSLIPLITGIYTSDSQAYALAVFKNTICTLDDINRFSTLRFTSGTLVMPKRPEGPTQGSIGIIYDYTILLYRVSDNFHSFVLWSWGDNTFSNWTGPYHPGESVHATHSWSDRGVFAIRVKIKDSNGHESRWSMPLLVTIE